MECGMENNSLFFSEELPVPRSCSYVMVIIQETYTIQVFCELGISGDVNFSKGFRT
jgi:hypothetical protein